MHKEQHKQVLPEHKEKELWGDYPYIVWTGSSQETPVVRFDAKSAISSDRAMSEVGKHYQLSYKISPYSSPLIRQILSGHGFQEIKRREGSFNLIWTGHKIECSTFTNLKHFQKINHFPNSAELGQKDLLFKNIRKMQKKYGSQRFNFLPKSYVLPDEYMDCSEAISKDGGLWIKKPVNSSQGLGIKVISSLDEVNRKETAMVSQYISNPYLVNGYKFDFRIYVLVTSYNPLIIYIYKEGLTRFATEMYDPTNLNLKNKFMHLTNTSVNKLNPNFLNTDDQDRERGGTMWTFSSMLRYLKKDGIDTDTLVSHIEDIVIKTIISVGGSIVPACRSKVPYKNNCFELYGFDILVDENLKPWLLEVNLSPALSTVNPMDLKVKANLVADTLTLVGVECQDPKQNAVQNQSMGYYAQSVKNAQNAKDEESRRGGFIRIFPRCDTVQRYGPLMEYPTLTYQLCERLFGKRSAEVKINKIEPKQNVEEYERKLPALPRIIAKEPKEPTIQSKDKMVQLNKDGSDGSRRHTLQKVQKLPLPQMKIIDLPQQPAIQKAATLPPIMRDFSIELKQNAIPKGGKSPPLQTNISAGTGQQVSVNILALPRSVKQTIIGTKLQTTPCAYKQKNNIQAATKETSVNKLKLTPLFKDSYSGLRTSTLRSETASDEKNKTNHKNRHSNQRLSHETSKR